MFILSYLFCIFLFITSFKYSITFDLTDLSLFNLTLDPAIQYGHIYDSLMNLFYETSTINIAYTNQFTVCDQYIQNIIEQQPNGENASQLYQIFDFSGKQSGELGQEFECLRHHYDYFLVLFNISLSKSKEISDDANAFSFFNPKRTFMGLCIPHECLEFTMSLFNTTYINEKLVPYLEDSFGFSGSEVMLDFDYNTEVTDMRKRTTALSGISFTVISLLSLSFLGIMVVCSIGKIIVFLLFHYDRGKKRGNQSKVGLLANSSEEEYFSGDNSEMENDYQKNEVGYNDGLLFGKKSIKKENLTQSQKRKLRVFNMLSKLDLVYNFQALFSKENRYYNDSGIELFGFLRIILMFFIIYNQNILTLLEIPGKDQYNDNFYSSWLFFLVKTSSYVPVCWIVLDGAEFSYKLMNYSKKYLHKNTKQTIPFIMYLKFMLFSIPKILQVLYIFFYFYLLNQYFSQFIDLGLLFDYYSGYILNQRECWRQPYTLFMPFSFNYIDYKNREFTNCYRFTNIYTNELYFIIILSIVVYISFKLRSKIFDYVVLLLAGGNTLVCFLSYFSKDLLKTDIDLRFTFGQNYTEKFPHLFFNIFIIGFYAGICYFYFNDAVLEDSLRQSEAQLPFQFCFGLIGSIDKIKEWAKKLILLCLLGFLFLLSFAPYISSYSYKSYLHPINSFDIFMDIYGKNLYAIGFGFIMLFLITYPKESTLKNLIQTNIFVPFERVSTAFLCMEDLIVYIIYCVFHFQLKMTYQNLFLISIGLLFISFFTCVITTICIEMTFRKLIKFITGSNKIEEDDNDEIISNEQDITNKIINEKSEDISNDNNIGEDINNKK